MFNKPLFSEMVKKGGTWDRRLYECMNSDCFYCATLSRLEEVHWKEVWNSEIEDLDMIPTCPSCNEPMAFWDYDTESEMARDKKELSHGKTTKS